MNEIEKAKRAEISKAVKLFKGNITQAAKYLGISRATIYRCAKRYNIDIIYDKKPMFEKP